MKLNIFLFTFIVIINLDVKAQSSIFSIFPSTRDDFCNTIIEDSYNTILGVGSSSIIVSDRSTWKAMLWAIKSNQDTLTRCFTFNDTASQFNHIEQRGDFYHLIATLFPPPEFNNSILQEIILDSNFNIYSRTTILSLNSSFLIYNKVKKLGEYYYILGAEETDTCKYEVIFKTSLDFDSVGYYRLWAHKETMMECLLSQDSSKFWLFTRGFNTHPGIELIEFELDFSSYSVRDLPTKQFPGTYDWEVYYGDNVTAKWITDTTFLIGCNHQQTFNNFAVVDYKFGFSILDSSLSLVPIQYYGAIDTMNCAGYITNFSFSSNDSVFFCGMKNAIPLFFPQNPSWIITGKFDYNLSPDYVKYYGGDAYYLPLSIIATHDGGSVIMGIRYDYLSQNYEYDVFFLRLNSQGLVVKDNTTSFKSNNITISPNPTSDFIKVETNYPKGEMLIYDITGQLLRKDLFDSSNFTVFLKNFDSGLYLLELRDKHGSHELIKFIINE